jgi:hypothetical protein
MDTIIDFVSSAKGEVIVMECVVIADRFLCHLQNALMHTFIGVVPMVNKEIRPMTEEERQRAIERAQANQCGH